MLLSAHETDDTNFQYLSHPYSTVPEVSNVTTPWAFWVLMSNVLLIGSPSCQFRILLPRSSS